LGFLVGAEVALDEVDALPEVVALVGAEVAALDVVAVLVGAFVAAGAAATGAEVASVTLVVVSADEAAAAHWQFQSV